ncbi:hypothetical protein MTDSW087_04308 [Methylobacterium dankookense]|uniref:DUF1508 domain-containing protein n=2 Tax=Methylobacterium dankookense TaxID=560405 RepID=A0A564G262_9HYPH|nr:hypothetical protein IFDJLNFL_5320 [Methylobacterium dankookense]VUF14583.1 hypothetical protein MTDSW087_04308 [Methylobacterium dankookense]
MRLTVPSARRDRDPDRSAGPGAAAAMPELTDKADRPPFTLTVSPAFRPAGWYSWLICRDGRPYQRGERSFPTEQKARADGAAAIDRLLR